MTEIPESSVNAVVQAVAGEYVVPMYWVRPSQALPTLPSESDVAAETRITVALRYAGPKQVTGTCGLGSLPFVVTIETDDASLSGEFLAAITVGEDEDVRRQGVVRSLQSPSHVRWVGTGMDTEVGDDYSSLSVEVVSEADVSLPTLTQFYAQLEVLGSKDCDGNGSRIEFVDGTPFGMLCLPDRQLAVWPTACGGVAQLSPDDEYRANPSTNEQLNLVSPVYSTGPFEGLFMLDLETTNERTCVGAEGTILGACEVVFETSTGRQTAQARVRSSTYEDPLVVEPVCFSLGEPDLLRRISEAALTFLPATECVDSEGFICDESQQESRELRSMLDAGLAAIDVCFDTAFFGLDGAATSEATFTFVGSDAREVKRGYVVGFERK